MEAYAKEQGYGSFEHFLDSVEAVKEMVFYHLIDGEANEVGNYETAGFTSGAIDTKNMLGRYLYTSIAPDGTSWMINNSARIVSGDHIKVNGVVHIVDKALAGNTDLLADYIETEGHFKLYGEALHATGLRNSLTLLDDETYVPATTKPSDDPYASGAEFPKTKNYRYTALLETDSVLALNGIRTLDDMREYAKRFLSGRERSAGYGRGQQPVPFRGLPLVAGHVGFQSDREHPRLRSDAHVDGCGLAA